MAYENAVLALDKFLFWAVFGIQLQVLCHLLKKHGMGHNLDEPEAFLVYMSITELHEMYDPVREILYKLSPTLLVVKADKKHLEGGKLLAHVCDYDAAVEVLKKILESCNPGDWEPLLNAFVCSLGNDSKWCGVGTENKIQPLVFLACKISQLPNDKCGSKILEALKLSNLENGRNICHCLIYTVPTSKQLLAYSLTFPFLYLLKFFEMPRHEAVKALDIYRRAGQQVLLQAWLKLALDM